MSALTTPKSRDSTISVTVVVPTHNSAAYLSACLQCLRKSVGCSYELIVVDDCSTDKTREIALRFNARVITLPKKSGPATARNRAVPECRSDILVFIDSDVLVRENTLQQLREKLEDDSLAAVFGSYDQRPKVRTFVSVYKNLMHHFFHQRAGGNVETFWSGCGAIRTAVFKEVGGFNENFPHPSIEDIELGMRLSEQGHSILLSPDIQAQHTKRWTLLKLIYTDVFRRGIPWTRLMFCRDGLKDNLNTQWGQRFSVMIAGVLLLVTGIISLQRPACALMPAILVAFLLATDFISTLVGLTGVVVNASAAILVVAALLCLVWEPLTLSILFLAVVIWGINLPSLLFLCRAEGSSFAVMSLPLHLLYFFYCGVAFAGGVLLHWMKIPLLKTQHREKTLEPTN